MSTITNELLEQNKKMLQSFLIEKPIPLEYRISNPYDLAQGSIPYGYIYCIENKINGKKYIGSAYSLWTDIQNPNPFTILRKRASQYIYEYNSILRSTGSNKRLARPIIQAMQEHGFENFIMYPIAETTVHTHAAAEKFFIDKYDTIASGYNIQYGGSYAKIQGYRLTARDKALRSDKIIAVNLNQKQLIFADSMKLLGDYLGTSKDIIKNQTRGGRQYKGWFMFYLDEGKRTHILEHFVLGDALGKWKHPTTRNHSEKSKQFYSELFQNISTYLKEPKSELFSDFTFLDPLEYESEVEESA